MKRYIFIVIMVISANSWAVPGNWSFGAGAIFSPNPYRNTKVNILPIPLIAYQNMYFAWYGPTVKLRTLLKPGHIIGVQGLLDPRIFDTKDTSNAQLRLLTKRRRSYLIGPYYRHQATYGDIIASINGDITGNSKGIFAAVSYGYPYHYQERRYFFKPSVGVEWSNNRMSNYYYGVSANESARSGLPAYTAGNNVTPYVGFFSGINLYKQLFWLAILRLNYIPSQIHNSPMVGGSRFMFSAFTGVTWEIGSKERRFN